ncbi:cell division control protein 16 [Meredithblackwellia eburnea MCA 4105]
MPPSRGIRGGSGISGSSHAGPSSSSASFSHSQSQSGSFSFNASANGSGADLPTPARHGHSSNGPRASISSASYDLSSISHLSTDQVENLRRQSGLSTLSLSPRRPGTAASGSTATTKAPRRTSVLSRAYHGPDGSFGMGVPGADGVLEEEDDKDDWTLVDRMRNWRNDAMTQHLYSTANFWGSKVFGITGNPNDAFWLAQVHFYTHQFTQAEKILTAVRPSPRDASGAKVGPPRRLTDVSLACRFLAAQCQVRLGKWEEALEMVGRGGILGNMASDEEQGDGGVKLTASTAHLRGLIHLHMGATDLAKDAFVEALSRDVKCFESFEMLVGSEMMSSDEEWEFIRGLRYSAQTPEDADFVRMMYTVRLKKIKHRDEMTEARDRLSEEYGLGQDPDVLFGLADELYTALRFAECYKVTSKILSIHSSHRPTLPLHLACMHHLPNLRTQLYLLAQELVENEPDDAISWYGVGLWYFSGRRWEESRRYFGKAVLIDSRFGPAWIAFAHSYAFEGEHDQAITAYSTALRHFQGTHLPLLFIGMQHLGLSNVNLAQEYLEAAKEGCPDDPLVLNELGVVAHHNGQFEQAIAFFKQALILSKKVQSSQASWATTHLNLGHAYRKLQMLPEAHASFRVVIQLDPRCGPAYSALGLVEHQLEHFQESIARYHEALSILPGDPVTCDLLKLVLEDAANSISTGAYPFPGLPSRALLSIDAQVAELDRAIINGEPPPDDESEIQEEASSRLLASSVGADEDIAVGGDEEPSYGEETISMDMSG